MNNDNLTTLEFWQEISWVALSIWMRVIIQYLGEIKQFGWLAGLVRHSCMAASFFFVVFLLVVTAYADCFNALEQMIILSGDRYDYLAFKMSASDLKELQESDYDTSFKANFEKWLV